LYARPGAALQLLQAAAAAARRRHATAQIDVIEARDLYINTHAYNSQLALHCIRDQIQWQTKCGVRGLAFDVDWVAAFDYDEVFVADTPQGVPRIASLAASPQLPSLLATRAPSTGAVMIEMFECYPQQRFVADMKLAMRPVAIREFMTHDGIMCAVVVVVVSVVNSYCSRRFVCNIQYNSGANATVSSRTIHVQLPAGGATSPTESHRGSGQQPAVVARHARRIPDAHRSDERRVRRTRQCACRRCAALRV
jgi:hypothetical protein